MTVTRYIRLHVFGGLSQREFAEMIGRRQATVSGWETGRADIGLNDLRAIRAVAKRKRLPWRDAIPFLSDAMLVKQGAKFSKGC